MQKKAKQMLFRAVEALRIIRQYKKIRDDCGNCETGKVTSWVCTRNHAYFAASPITIASDSAH